MGGLFEDIKGTGLGGVVKDIKRVSRHIDKIKVPKVSHGVRKIKHKYSKTVRAESKKRVKQTIHRRKVSARTKEAIKRYDKYGDRIYKK